MRWAARSFDAAVWIAVVLITAVFAIIIGDVIWHGIAAVSATGPTAIGSAELSATDLLHDWGRYLTGSPGQSGRSGGIAPILVSTLLVLTVCLGVSVPLGTATAVCLSEYVTSASRFGRTVRRSLDVLAGMPSIVFGLFGNAFFCRLLDLRFSILAGGLTLACMVLPLLIRATEEGLRSVPAAQRQAAAALGFSRTTTIWRIVLPQATSGMIVGTVLAVGRALAETAALIFTSGYVDRMPQSVMDSGRTLSLHIYDLSMNVPGGNNRAYAAALVLIVLLILINTTAAWLTRKFLHRRLLPQ